MRSLDNQKYSIATESNSQFPKIEMAFFTEVGAKLEWMPQSLVSGIFNDRNGNNSNSLLYRDKLVGNRNKSFSCGYWSILIEDAWCFGGVCKGETAVYGNMYGIVCRHEYPCALIDPDTGGTFYRSCWEDWFLDCKPDMEEPWCFGIS